MKKKLLFLISSLFLLTACGHTHSYGEWQKLDNDFHESVCSCGDKKMERHSFTQTVIRASTHTESGECEYKCEKCGYTYTDSLPIVAEHSFTKQVVDERYLKSPANCLHAAEYYYSCECGEKGSETFTYGELGEHSYVEQSIVNPTYTQPGSHHLKCSVCGDEKDESLERLGILGKEEAIRKSGSINILTIGNSLTDDVCQHLHEILHGLGIQNVTIGKMWVGGTNINYHHTHMIDDSPVYTFEYYNEQNGRWVIDGTKRSMSYAFNFKTWDYISISSVGQAIKPAYPIEDINGATNYILEHGHDAIPLWYTPGLPRESYFNNMDIVKNNNYDKQKALAEYETLMTDYVMANGNIQDFVSSLTVQEILNKTYNFDIFHRDDVHYSYPLGCVVTGMMYAKTILPHADFSSFPFPGINKLLLEDIALAVNRSYGDRYDFQPLTIDPEETVPGYVYASGAFQLIENGFESLSNQSLMYKNNKAEFTAGSIEYTCNPFANNYHGAIFALSHSVEKFWTALSQYYYAGISLNGEAFWAKNNKGYITIFQSTPIKNFDASNNYRVKILYKNGHAAVYVDDELLVNYLDNEPLTGKEYGFRAESLHTSFSNVSFTENPDIVLPEIFVPQPIDGYTFRHGTYVKDSNTLIAYENNSILEYNTAFNGGTITYDFKSINGGESGLIFGLTNSKGLTDYWETDVSYYMAAITASGGCGFAGVNHNGNAWEWLNEPTANRIEDFNPNAFYSVKIVWDKENGLMQMYVNDLMMVSYQDRVDPLEGSICGFRSGKKDNQYRNVTYSSELPPMPDGYIDIVGGWNAIYNEETESFDYTNKTNRAFRLFTKLTISGKGTITYTYKNTGLGCTDGVTQISNWVAGLALSTKLDVTNTTGPFMVIGKTCGAPKRITSIFVDTSTSWNNPTGTNIVVEDGVAVDLTLNYDFSTGTIDAIGNGCTCHFTMPAALKSAGKLYLGLFGTSMKSGYKYGEINISHLTVSPEK